MLVSNRIWILLVLAHVPLSTIAVRTLGLVFKYSAAEIHFPHKICAVQELLLRARTAEIRTWGSVLTGRASWKLHPSLESCIANYTASQLRSFPYI